MSKGCFIPFWIHFASTLGAKAERRQSGGRVEASCVPTVYYIIPEKPKNRVPLLRKKVASDDNNNYNRCVASVHSPFTLYFTNFVIVVFSPRQSSSKTWLWGL